MTKRRCPWAEDVEDIYVKYHDEEWGVQTHDDQELFELLVLESFQAGLAWITILKKRENFREAFDNFDIEKVAAYDEEKIEELKARMLSGNHQNLQYKMSNQQRQQILGMYGLA